MSLILVHKIGIKFIPAGLAPILLASQAYARRLVTQLAFDAYQNNDLLSFLCVGKTHT
jgi:hypothetical protein